MILRTKLLLLLVCSSCSTIGTVCSNPGTEAGRADETPVKIIFDTDMGSDCDDVGALALLHAYVDLGRAEIIGCIYSSSRVPYGAGVTDAINVYYGRPDIPVGADHSGEFGDPVDKMQAEKLAKDTSAFGNRIVSNREAVEQTLLNRRLLHEADDDSITYVTVGHTRALYQLMRSNPDDISPLTGDQLIRKKVLRWVALGALNANNEQGQYKKDWNFCFNGSGPYTEYLVANFPKQVVFISDTTVKTGATLVDTSSGNIVRTAYRDWLWNVERKTISAQRYSWDLVAIFYAVEGLGDFLLQEEMGKLKFDSNKGSRWVRSEDDPQQHFIYENTRNASEFGTYLNRMIGAPPLLSQ